MDLKKLAESLHPLERKVLPCLDKNHSIDAVIRVSGLKEVEVVRALQWLENKKLVRSFTDVKDVIFLDKNGLLYRQNGLPEKKFLQALEKGAVSMSKMRSSKILSDEELNVCIGSLRSINAVIISKDKELVFGLTEKGKALLKQPLPEELFLKKDFPLAVNSLSESEKKIMALFRKRKNFIMVDEKKSVRVELSDLGRKIFSQKLISGDFIDSLTPDILKSGDWKKKSFRRYDIYSSVPKFSAGRLHHYRAFLDSVREKFLSLGFAEMSGPIVESDFWDMDALFMPQFHSARDIHEAYYVKEPKQANIDRKILERVKQAHESGKIADSKGWGYSFDEERTRRLLLRTQGTACSARMLADKNLKIPGKYFGVTRCFRYDVIDATHLPDFTQTEGIVVEENLTFRHLVGLLKQFAKEFAEASEIKLVPAYFPFTEPSVELVAKHPQLGWIELGGAGIFRPEVVVPLLGRYVPVIAWGLGIDRIGMFKLGVKDIRSLFSQDLDFLRSSKVII